MNDLLNLILDTLIPPSADGQMPGAGSLDITDSVRAQAAAAGDVLESGLAAAESKGFAKLDEAARVVALREIETAEPAFIPTLFIPTCLAYYKHPKVLIGLGLDPRPPFPRGYTLEPGNLDGLERVRARGKIYRDA